MIEDTHVGAGAPAAADASWNTPFPAGSGDAGAGARRAELASVFHAARACTRCAQLVAARTQVVFGGGDADADLMLIGEAPGAREDEHGEPFIGAAGKLLDELLASIGLTRADVFVTSALKCRPPSNRDPSPTEIERCRPYLDQQIALVRPRVIATLGNFATRQLRGDTTPITELHGRPEVRVIEGRTTHLLPLFHPAAALYTRALLDTLRDDFARLADLLALPPFPAEPEPAEPEPEPEPAEPEPPVPEREPAELAQSAEPAEPERRRASGPSVPGEHPAGAGAPSPPDAPPAGESDQLGLF